MSDESDMELEIVFREVDNPSPLTFQETVVQLEEESPNSRLDLSTILVHLYNLVEDNEQENDRATARRTVPALEAPDSQHTHDVPMEEILRSNTPEAQSISRFLTPELPIASCHSPSPTLALREHGLTLTELLECLQTCESSPNADYHELVNLIESVFSSFPSIANSFNLDTGLLDILALRKAYATLLTVPHDGARRQLQGILLNTFRKTITKRLRESIDTLRSNCQDLARSLASGSHERPTESGGGLFGLTVESPEQSKVDCERRPFSYEPEDLATQVTHAFGCFSAENKQLINVLQVAFECPLLLDNLHFETLLPALCMSAAWLPLPLQSFLCCVWAVNAAIPFHSNVESRQAYDDQPDGGDKHLLSLQQILLQHVTLKSLTLDGQSPNGDRGLHEACILLRIVYYASLIAGGIDRVQLRRRESIENEQFAAYMRQYPLLGDRRVLPPRTDPLGLALGITPMDCRRGLIPDSEFVNQALNSVIDEGEDLANFILPLRFDAPGQSRYSPTSLSFMHFPFLLLTSTKSTHLYYDNRLRMYDQRNLARTRAYLDDAPESMYLKMCVKRDEVVEDALVYLDIVCSERPSDLKKQLFIEFVGEQGIDEGGLTKEFFQLIVARLFNADYAMFVRDEETHCFWFNRHPLEDMEREYCLIGIILGLAIYNHVILDVHFPPVLYRKLLGKLGTFHDLKVVHPSLSKGLQAMLNFQGSAQEFEACFCARFEVTFSDVFGSSVTRELVPNGSSMPVTLENRDEYVELYADFMLNSSVRRQFNAFRRGFQLVIDESPIPFLLRADEIELLIRGSDEFNFEELERVTKYGPGLSSDARVIHDFWSVVHEMHQDEKRKLLQFATGTDRIPVGGMSQMKFSIMRQGPDSDRLPAAHTCFNILLLPEYSSRDKLKDLLHKAIAHSHGFGMF